MSRFVPPPLKASIPGICSLEIDYGKHVVRIKTDGKRTVKSLKELSIEAYGIIVLEQNTSPCRLSGYEQCIVGTYLGLKLFNTVMKRLGNDRYIVPVDHSGYIMSVHGFVSDNPYLLFKLIMTLVGAVIDSCPDSLKEMVESFNSFPFLSVIEGPLIGNIDMYFFDGERLFVCRDDYESVIGEDESSITEMFTRFIRGGETENGFAVMGGAEFCLNKFRRFLVETGLRHVEREEDNRENN